MDGDAPNVARKQRHSGALAVGAMTSGIVAEARRRGRPRKPAPAMGPCTEPFDEVARRIVAAAADTSLWLAAKDRARAKAECDRSLSPAALKVFSFLLDHINRDKGYDWHGIDAIAAGRRLNQRTVQKGLMELGAAGYALREHEIVSGSRASKRWRTTLPALARVADEIRRERAEKDTPENTERTRPKNSKDTPNYSEGHEQKMQEGHAQMGTLTFKDRIQESNTHTQPARRAREAEIFSILKEVTTNRRRHVINHLIAPLIRQRDFHAPDRAFALGRIADQAADLPPDTLSGILEGLLRSRAAVVKPSDLEGAIRSALAKVERQKTEAAEREVKSRADELIARINAAATLEVIRGMLEEVKLARSALSAQQAERVRWAYNQRRAAMEGSAA